MAPYLKFGKVLHTLRRTYHVSKKEICGALEITDQELENLEAGTEQPSEEIIEQIINHFELDDNLAQNLWRLAGFNDERLDDLIGQSAVLPMAELKASYTDMVHVSVNNFGVTLSFLQNIGPQNQPVVVSRLGMSREHAESVANVILRTLKASNDQKTHKPLGLPGSDAS